MKPIVAHPDEATGASDVLPPGTTNIEKTIRIRARRALLAGWPPLPSEEAYARLREMADCFEDGPNRQFADPVGRSFYAALACYARIHDPEWPITSLGRADAWSTARRCRG